MHKIFSVIILTTLLILSGAVTGSAAWQLTIDVSTPDPNSNTGADTIRLTIGTDQTATDSYGNKFDTVALLRRPVETYMVHPEYATEQQRLWRNIRSDELSKEGTIEGNSPREGNTIYIKWGLNALDNMDFTLINQDNNQEISLSASSEYSYISTSNSQKTFLLRISKNTSVTPGGNDAVNTTKGGGCGYIQDINIFPMVPDQQQPI